VAVLEKLRGIVRKYDGVAALKRVSLDVQEGEILTIIGPNGSGKTSLLRIMALLDRPAAGEVYYRGEKVDNSSAGALRGKVTMVFQKAALFNTTIYKNVAYGLEIKKRPENEINRRVKRALSLVGLEKYAGRRAKKLSGGEQQRVVLARTLVLEPELLLLDEPTANLDPANATAIEKIIRKIKGETTVVLATHNIFQAKRMSDRIACLLDGVIIGEGTVKEVFERSKDVRIKKIVKGELL
jgi:tungstate transport system ATP-binding protein